MESYPQVEHKGQENLPTPKEMHQRAAISALETRRTILTLSTASVGGLFWFATREINPALSGWQPHLILASIITMSLAVAMGLWSAFADSQWSYWWGVELDSDRPQDYRETAREKKLRWNMHKGFCERANLIFFFMGILFASLFVVLRLYA